MEINRRNYEQYFIDYLDGKLDYEQVEILMAFLEFNPDLNKEFADIEKLCLEPDETYFAEKAGLLKSEADLLARNILKDFDMYCISSVENDITQEEETILQGIIKEDPFRENTYRLYQAARLISDDSIRYPRKSMLKKRYITVPFRILIPAAAAMAVLVLIFQLFIGKNQEVGSLTQTQEIPVNASNNEEESPTLTQESTPAIESPSIAGVDNSTEFSTASHMISSGRESVSAVELINAGESVFNREIIQLAKVEPKFIQQVEVPSAFLNQTNVTYPERKKNMPEQSRKDPRLSLWKLADAGVRGLNSIAEEDYHLNRKKDENGNTRRFTFDSPIFGISAPLRNPDTQ